MSEQSAAMMAMASQPLKIETISLPGFAPKQQNSFDISKFRVRYMKTDMDDTGSITDLEIIETKGLKGEEIVVLNKHIYTFMDKVFVLVTFLEAIDPGTN
jgi:hypothetical protein